jgi:hypothetical protein
MDSSDISDTHGYTPDLLLYIMYRKRALYIIVLLMSVGYLTDLKAYFIFVLNVHLFAYTSARFFFSLPFSSFYFAGILFLVSLSLTNPTEREGKREFCYKENDDVDKRYSENSFS